MPAPPPRDRRPPRASRSCRCAVDDEGACGRGAGRRRRCRRHAGAPVPARRRRWRPTAASGARRVGARRGAVVIEDDYDGEFRYDRQPPGALQGLDPEHVVYAGTASKTLTPGCGSAGSQLPAPVARAGDRGEDGRRRHPGARPARARRAARRRAPTTGTCAGCASATAAAATSCSTLLAHPRARAPHARGRRRAARRALDVPDEAALVGARRRALTRAHGLGPFWHEPREDRQGVVLGYAAPPEHAYGRDPGHARRRAPRQRRSRMTTRGGRPRRHRNDSQARPSAGATSSRTVASTASRR